MHTKSVVQIIAETLNVCPTIVHRQANLFDDLGANSLTLMDLIISIEERFGFDLTILEVLRVKTVQDCIDYVNDKVR